MCRKSILQLLIIVAVTLVCTNARVAALTVDVRVSASADDVEEGSNTNYTSSSDLELINDNADNGGRQFVGMNFRSINVPPGAIIKSAYIEFVCDETKDGTAPAYLLIWGNLSPNPDVFTAASVVSSRPRTQAKVPWEPEQWTTVGQISRTSDISSIIQEIVNQDGWASGNTIGIAVGEDTSKGAFTGSRCAESFDGSAAQAPLLHIEFSSKSVLGPVPADGSKYEATWASLAWTAGETAATHDVYMSDNFDDVNDGAAAAFQTNVPLPFATVGFFGFPFPDGLVPGTTYYWRVDEVEADGVTKYAGPVWSFWIPPRNAYAPAPFDGSSFVPADSKLSWQPGFAAKLHYVYLGKTFDEVNNATTGTASGATTFNPGALELNTTYYWRVDELDPPNPAVKGQVWSFTTTLPGLGSAVMERWENLSGTSLDPLKSSPKYPNNPDVTETVTRFLWDGPDIDNYAARIEGWVYVPATGDYTFWLATDDNGELWLSTDDDSSNVELIASVPGWSNVTDWTKYASQKSAPIPLIGGERYYIMALWSEGGGGDHCNVAWEGPGIPQRTTIPGSNLSPYEPKSAYGAKPTNYAVDVTQTPTLQWKAGLEAASHDVYFGTDPDAVANATKASPEYKGSRQLGSESYEPAALAWNTAYYWRVDEINTGNAESPWVGKVWSFTTANYGVVEDFEAYNDIPSGEPGSKLVYETWVDGYGIPTNGSTMGYTVPFEPTMETDIVYAGQQSAPMAYSNIGTASSEVTRTFSPARNWAANGIQTLSLVFFGDPANTPGQLYVKINGLQVNYNGAPGDLSQAGWQAWNIDLTKVGTNLASVTSLAIGVQGLSATGTLLLDNVTLHAEPGELITPVQPNAAGLVAHYRLDGNVQDASGRGNHGTAGGNPIYGAGAVGTQAISLDGIDDYVSIDGVADDITTNDFTVSVWIKTTMTGDGNAIASNDSASGHQFILGVDESVLVEANTINLYPPVVNDNKWYMLTYTREGNTANIYVNGFKVGTETATGNPAAQTRWSIGQEWDAAGTTTPSDFFVGMVDDVRFYNYPLSEAEVAGLAGRTQPFHKPF